MTQDPAPARGLMVMGFVAGVAAVCAGNLYTVIPELSMPNEEQVHLATESFRMLADPTRIKIVWALLQGESSVNCLADLVGASTTTVSQHLAKLRLAGLVRGRREGTFIYYAAGDTRVRALLAEALFHADHADHGLEDDWDHNHTVGSTPSRTAAG